MNFHYIDDKKIISEKINVKGNFKSLIQKSTNTRLLNVLLTDAILSMEFHPPERPTSWCFLSYREHTTRFGPGGPYTAKKTQQNSNLPGRDLNNYHRTELGSTYSCLEGCRVSGVVVFGRAFLSLTSSQPLPIPGFNRPYFN